MPDMPFRTSSPRPTISSLRQQLEALIPSTPPSAKRAAAAASQASAPAVGWMMDNAPLLLDAALAFLRRRRAELPAAPAPFRRRSYVRPLVLIGLGACVAYGVSRAMSPARR